MTDPQDNPITETEGRQALATVGDSDQMLFDAKAFEHAQRVATMFSKSQLVPAHLQNRPADCFLALHMAHRMGEDPLMVAQNIVIIQGTAGWKAQWLVARANRTGALGGRIKYETEQLGEPIPITRRIKDENKNWKTVDAEVPNIAVTAYAKDADGDRVSYRVTMQMAIDEGWTQNPKYSSIGELMLCYRAASFLIRLNAPEVAMGYQTAEELEDMTAAGRIRDVSPPQGETATDALSQLGPAESATEAAESTIVEPGPSQGDEENTSDAQTEQTEEAETTQTEPDPQSTVVNPEGVPLYDASGNNLGGYQRQGSWLNALIKLVTEADDRFAVYNANRETIERIRVGGAYAEKIGQLNAIMTASTETEEGDDGTSDWLSDHAAASQSDSAVSEDDVSMDQDLYTELTDDLESLVAAQDTSRIRDRLNRADDIVDGSIRADAQNELTAALQRAQP